MSKQKEPGCFSRMRAFMRRLGFHSPSIKKSKDVPGVYVLTAYDPVDRYYFCRSYTVEDIECIGHANDIFWRYIK